VLLEATPAQRDAAIAAIREMLGKILTPTGIRLGYAAWIVTAER
jgi:hypothetical protein